MMAEKDAQELLFDMAFPYTRGFTSIFSTAMILTSTHRANRANKILIKGFSCLITEVGGSRV